MKDDTRIMKWLWVALTVGLAVITFDILLFPAPPVASWQIGDARNTEPYTEVAPETPISMDISLRNKSWVYAVSHDLDRGTIALFPSVSLLADRRQNPLPAGNHRLPGQHQGKDLLWHSGDMPGAVAFLVVVSDHPLPELEQQMSQFRQMGNAAFPLRSKLGTYAPKEGMKVVPNRLQIHTAVLKAAHKLEDPWNDGSFTAWTAQPGVYLKNMNVQNKYMSDGAKQDVREQLEAMNKTFLQLSKDARDGSLTPPNSGPPNAPDLPPPPPRIPPATPNRGKD